MQPNRLRKMFRQLCGDRRGVTSLAFAGSLITVLGAAGIATDVGVWYAARRGAQNAADVGATAAAVSLAMSNATNARAVALDTTARNGFPNAGANTVTVNIPPTQGAHRANATAVEVVVRQTQSLSFSGYFISAPPVVQGRSVATLREASNVCILALSGELSAGGNTAVNTPNCVLASNFRSSPSVRVTGNSIDVRAYSISAVRTCLNCENGGVRLTERFGEFQPPTADPYAALNSKPLPQALSNANCVNRGGGRNQTLSPYETNGRKLYCGNIRVNGGDVFTLEPGTYYIHEGDLIVQGGGTLQCPTCTAGRGVAIVFTGATANRIGGVNINGNAVVDLRAARTAADPDFNGILFYRDIRATANSTSNPAVDLNGTATVKLSGGMYFPSTHVRMTGTAGTIACSVLVAASVEFNGNADVTGCAEVGTRVPQTRIVMVAE
jgi:hypothetical protein